MVDIAAIQYALKEQHLDGWLFFDHHERDPLAYRVLKFQAPRMATRRWYYFIPSSGEPARLVHRIESTMLDAVPGRKIVYSGWSSQMSGLRELLGGAKRIAMQYSPNCAIPYVSMVDAGTLELVRGLGIEVVSSADLVQLFEARCTEAQRETHFEAGRRVDEVRRQAFQWIGEALRAGRALSEWDVNRFVRRGFDERGLITDHGPIVAVNANMSDPHYEPTAERHSPIKSGDAVLLDMWAKLDRPGAIYYDITWTGHCGPQPPPELLNIFDVVRGARDTAIAFVENAIARRESIQGFQVDDAARGYIASKGYADFFVHRTGHSIGEDVHGTGANMDNLETHDERAVIAGTCFSIEPGVYLERFGIRSEVNIFIGSSAAEVTGEIQRELVII